MKGEQGMLLSREDLAAKVPDTGWTPPQQFPRLDAAKEIAIDVETKDKRLKQDGPGDIRGDGKIVGIAVGTDDGGRWYFPMRHEFGHQNMDPEMVLRWAREELSRPHQPKIGANLMYDVSMLRADGVNVAGDLIDVQSAQALLDENAFSYALEKLARQWLNEGKKDNDLYHWLADTYGGKFTRKDQAGNIYRAPVQLVGPYAEGDVDLPLRIWHLQRRELEKQELLELFQLETDLLPLLLEMRWHGVAVDVDRADEVRATMRGQQAELQKKLNKMAGAPVDVWAAETIARAFDAEGIHYPHTAKTKKPSFTKAWLENHESELAQMIVQVRSLDKTIGTFIDGHILGSVINGRIHAQFHPLRGDENGTVSGRFSSSNPNLQNIPSRDKIIGPLIRSLFIPDPGDPYWRRYDYSQIEYRLLSHFAVGPGADEARERYRKDPKTDYHQMTRELIHVITAIMLDRKPTKNINFGLCYGMGVPALAANLGMTVKEATPLFEAYHEGVPFVKKTYDLAISTAKNRGYVKTVLGRRRRFDLFESANFMDKAERDKMKPLPKEDAIREYGSNIQRAGTHAALNAVLQGSSADMMKKAMRDAHRAGVFDATGIPLITVHDELNFSDSGTQEAAEGFRELVDIMENCIQLKIPVVVDGERGPNWGTMEDL